MLKILPGFITHINHYYWGLFHQIAPVSVSRWVPSARFFQLILSMVCYLDYVTYYTILCRYIRIHSAVPVWVPLKMMMMMGT